MNEQKTFTEQAGVAYAAAGRRGKRVHYSPRNDETLCGRGISEYLDRSDAAARFDKGHELCIPCHRAAEKRAKTRRAAEPEQPTPAEGIESATEQVPTGHDEPSDTWTIMTRDEVEIARVQGATAEEMTRAAEALPEVQANIHREGGFARRRLYMSELAPAERGAEHRVIEGIVVEHAGTAEGSLPKHAAHPDVVAARGALAGLAAATMTDHHDVTEPTEDERTVRGYIVDPRKPGVVYVSWLEGGRAVRRDEMPHGPALGCLADVLARHGWDVWRMPRSSRCVIAGRPSDVEAPKCMHGHSPRAGVPGDPVAACDGRAPGVRGGVWSDEGCVYVDDCVVDAANECARLTAEEPAEEPLYSWHRTCPEHDEQTLDECEVCNVMPAEEQCPECAGCGCHWCHWTGEKQSEKDSAGAPEATWRGGWITGTAEPEAGALFALDDNTGEQGALFG
ncbi:hypothetical protein ACFY2W_23360 [Streptomyces sp. NPDC001262]|uniref:hypothetical protein n=1 Tax=Streptomyces sp. NPDC001262 TaxID=3364552 RepID=UPI0036A2CDCD